MIFSVLSDRSENENITAIIVIVMISMILREIIIIISPLKLPKYIFFYTGSNPVWILCQIICNSLVRQQRNSVNFDPVHLIKLYK